MKLCQAVQRGGDVYGYRIGAVFGSIDILTGAIAGSICCTITGCEAGHATGTVIDENIINGHQCNDNHHSFSN